MTVSRFDSKSWLLFADPGLRFLYSAATPDVCPDALFVASDTFFDSRPVQFATLTARDRIPATYAIRDYVAAGGLMSYGTDLAEMFHQVGVYTGSILKGAKPTDLPVMQSTKFKFVINLQTSRALGIEYRQGCSPSPTR